MCIRDSNYNVVLGNTINEGTNYGITVVTNSHYNNIISNYIDGVTTDGIFISSQWTNVEGNEIHNTDGSGISTAAMLQRYNIINGNNISQCAENGIEIIANMNTTISNNNVFSCEYSGIFLNAGKLCNIVGNNVRDCNCNTANSHAGIDLYADSSENAVTGNISETNNNGGHGIYAHGGDNTITANVCKDNTGDGIHIYFLDNNVVSSNRCTGNTGWGINISVANSDKTIVLGNQLLGNTTGALNDIGTATEQGHNVVV